MSGGSYNYLCDAHELADLLRREHDLKEMADRLAGMGGAEDAARETEELLVQLRQWKVRAEVRVRRLSDVWQAVEWEDSGDGHPGQIGEALSRYRGAP
ncbi:hypothetical protein OG216_09765 [Streptomycetaceae bacterium NBC_01309]